MEEENERLESTIELAESVLELLTENMKLQIKINKAIDIIKGCCTDYDGTIVSYGDDLDPKELLEILGDKENE